MATSWPTPVLARLFVVAVELVKRSRRTKEDVVPPPFGRPADDARLATIVRDSADAILSLTLEGKVITWNTSAEAMFGYTAEEMMGQSVSRLAPPEGSEDQGKLLRQVREGRTVRHSQAIRLRKDGTYLTVSLTISPMYQEGEGVVAMSAIVRDRQRRQSS